MEIRSGVGLADKWEQYVGIKVRGDLLTDSQLKQIRTSAYHLYGQNQQTAKQLYEGTGETLKNRGLPPDAFIRPVTQVVNPDTGEPVRTKALPAHTAASPNIDPALVEEMRKRGLKVPQ